jgi:hypothetical protein
MEPLTSRNPFCGAGFSIDALSIDALASEGGRASMDQSTLLPGPNPSLDGRIASRSRAVRSALSPMPIWRASAWSSRAGRARLEFDLQELGGLVCCGALLRVASS